MEEEHSSIQVSSHSLIYTKKHNNLNFLVLADLAGLKLTGMRVGPIDPETKVARVGVRPEAYTKPKDFHE